MKRNILILPFLFILILFSCKKEKINGGTDTVKTVIPLLTEVLINNQPLYKYTYNDSTFIIEEQCKYYISLYNYDRNQISSAEYYENENVLSKDSLTYTKAINNSAWVTMGNGINGGNLSYAYNLKGQLIQTKFSSPQSLDTLDYSEFLYDNKNRITRQTVYLNATNVGYVDYTYDGNGNLTSESLYYQSSSGTAELITKIDYNFDSKHNPYKSLSNLILPGINTNTNNIIQETRTIHLLASDTIIVTKNTYAYNLYGYPSTKNGNVLFNYQ